jgi:hypothetical protein
MLVSPKGILKTNVIFLAISANQIQSGLPTMSLGMSGSKEIEQSAGKYPLQQSTGISNPSNYSVNN